MECLLLSSIALHKISSRRTHDLMCLYRHIHRQQYTVGVMAHRVMGKHTRQQVSSASSPDRYCRALTHPSPVMSTLRLRSILVFARASPLFPCKVCLYPPHTPVRCPRSSSDYKSSCCTELAAGSSILLLLCLRSSRRPWFCIVLGLGHWGSPNITTVDTLFYTFPTIAPLTPSLLYYAGTRHHNKPSFRDDTLYFATRPKGFWAPHHIA